jgi:hypothetical protein
MPDLGRRHDLEFLAHSAHGLARQPHEVDALFTEDDDRRVARENAQGHENQRQDQQDRSPPHRGAGAPWSEGPAVAGPFR